MNSKSKHFLLYNKDKDQRKYSVTSFIETNFIDRSLMFLQIVTYCADTKSDDSWNNGNYFLRSEDNGITSVEILCYDFQFSCYLVVILVSLLTLLQTEKVLAIREKLLFRFTENLMF
jgi:hypothetical protein